MLDNLQASPGNRILGAATTPLSSPTLPALPATSGTDVTAEAGSGLDATGYSHVNVLTGDGQLGDPDHGRYDRIIVTVGAWDIPGGTS